MATIPEIERDLLLASSTGDFTLFDSTLQSILPNHPSLITIDDIGEAIIFFSVRNNVTALSALIAELTPAQRTELGTTSYVGQAFAKIIMNDMPFDASDDSPISYTVRELMKKLGTEPYINISDIGNAMTAFSANANYIALDALTDYLTAAQKGSLGASNYIIDTLKNLAVIHHTAPLIDDYAIAAATHNLMGKLGAYISDPIDIKAIGDAMSKFSYEGNFAALAAVTDYLTEQQKDSLGATGWVTTSLSNISFMYDLSPSVDDDAIVEAIRDLMSKLGTYIDDPDEISSIGEAMINFVNSLKFSALDAVTDYLTDQQKEVLGSSWYVTTIISEISLQHPPTDSDVITSTVRNLMEKMGAFIHPDEIHYIGAAMYGFINNHNFAAFDALTDHLTDQQKVALGATNFITNTLQILANMHYSSSLVDASAIASTTRDLMEKMGAYINDPLEIGYAMIEFAYTRNFAALDAVTDYLTEPQKEALGSMRWITNTLSNLVFYKYMGSWTAEEIAATNTAARDLMEKLGAYIPPSYMQDFGHTMIEFAIYFNLEGLDALTDYLTEPQKVALGASIYVRNAIGNLASYTYEEPPNVDDADIATAVRDLMEKLGAYISNPHDIRDLIQNAASMFSSSGKFAALDAITDHLTETQKNVLGENPNIAGNILGHIVSHYLYDYHNLNLDDATAIALIRDHLEKLGAQTDAMWIGGAMRDLAAEGKFAALDAVTDYLTDAQRLKLSSTYYVGRTLLNIVSNYQNFLTVDDADITNATRDLMSKLGLIADAYSIGNAMASFAILGKFSALDAVTDYLMGHQKTALGETSSINDTLTYLIYHDYQGTFDDITLAAAARDLTAKLGGQYDDTSIASLIGFSIFNGNINMVDALVGELPNTKIIDVLNLILPNLALAGITLGTNSSSYDLTSGADKHLALFGDDRVYGYGGDDQIFGDAGNDRLDGNDGDDLLHGGSGGDTLYGHDGNDILIGGTERDTLYGGTGADTFVFELADRGIPPYDYDTITDFNSTEGDVIDISNLLSQYNPLDDAISAFVRFTPTWNATLLEVDVDGAEASVYGFATVAYIQGVTNLDLETLVNNGSIIV